MDYYILENLNNPNTKKSLTHPSQLSGAVPSFTDKEKFREWCIDEKTKHVFYTTFEGANPHQRISGGNLLTKCMVLWPIMTGREQK